MSVIACMGGWCARREDCDHFHAKNTAKPVERLCPHGEDDPEEPVIQRSVSELAPLPVIPRRSVFEVTA